MGCWEELGYWGTRNWGIGLLGYWDCSNQWACPITPLPHHPIASFLTPSPHRPASLTHATSNLHRSLRRLYAPDRVVRCVPLSPALVGCHFAQADRTDD